MENNPFKHVGEGSQQYPQLAQPEFQQVQDERLHRIDHQIVGRSRRGRGGPEAIGLVAVLVIAAIIMLGLVVIGGIYLFAPALLGGL